MCRVYIEIAWRMDPRERSPPASRPPRRILKVKRRFVEASEMPVRNLLKEKLKSQSTEDFKEAKKEADMAALEKAFGTMDVSESKAKKARYEGGWYHIHTGDRGGKYIIVQGEKKYLPRKSK